MQNKIKLYIALDVPRRQLSLYRLTFFNITLVISHKFHSSHLSVHKSRVQLARMQHVIITTLLKHLNSKLDLFIENKLFFFIIACLYIIFQVTFGCNSFLLMARVIYDKISTKELFR